MNMIKTLKSAIYILFKEKDLNAESNCYAIFYYIFIIYIIVTLTDAHITSMIHDF